MERFEKEKVIKEIIEAHRGVKEVKDIWIANRILDVIESWDIKNRRIK